MPSYNCTLSVGCLSSKPFRLRLEFEDRECRTFEEGPVSNNRSNNRRFAVFCGLLKAVAVCKLGVRNDQNPSRFYSAPASLNQLSLTWRVGKLRAEFCEQLVFFLVQHIRRIVWCCERWRLFLSQWTCASFSTFPRTAIGSRDHKEGVSQFGG